MNTQTITINKKKYTVKFGIQSNVILGEMWKITKLSQIGKRISKLNFKEGAEPTMEQLLIMSQLVLSGIKSKHPNTIIDEDDVFEFIAKDADTASKLMELYAKSLPQSKNVQPDQRK